MAPNERAQKNHDELFPGHVSTLAVTDPELIEAFDNSISVSRLPQETVSSQR
jgi:hypothetical protein